MSCTVYTSALDQSTKGSGVHPLSRKEEKVRSSSEHREQEEDLDPEKELEGDQDQGQEQEKDE